MKILSDKEYNRLLDLDLNAHQALLDEIEDLNCQNQYLEEDLKELKAKYYEAINHNNNLQMELSRRQKESKDLEESIKSLLKKIQELSPKIDNLEAALQYKEQYI